MYPEALTKKSVEKETIEEMFPIVVNHLYDWPNPRKLLGVARKVGTKHYSTKGLASVVLVMAVNDAFVFLVNTATCRGGWLPLQLFHKNYEKITRKEALRRLTMHGKGGSYGKRN